jgi:hypothetical protein
MSLPIETPQTPEKDHAATDGTLEALVPAICLQDTPDSQASIESQDDYGFWDIEEKTGDGGIDGPLTPITPFNHEECQKKPEAHLSTPQSARLKKSKSDSQLSIRPFSAVEPDDTKNDPFIKTEPDDNRPEWLFPQLKGQAYSNEAPFKDFWRTDTKRDGPAARVLNESDRLNLDCWKLPTAPAKDTSKISRTDVTTGKSQISAQPSRPRLRKTDGSQDDTPTPSPSKRTPPLSFKIEQTSTTSEIGLTAINESIHVDGSLGDFKQQTCAFVLARRTSTFQQTSQATYEVNGSEFSEERSTKHIFSSNILARIIPFNIRERLAQRPGQCVASKIKKPDQQCSKRANGRPEAAIRHLDSLSDINLSDSTRIIAYITGAIDLTLCNGWHRKTATRELESWLSKSAGLSKPQRTSAVDLNTFKVWINALNGTTTFKATVKSESSALAVSSSDQKNQHFAAATSTQTTTLRSNITLQPTSATATTTKSARHHGRTSLTTKSLSHYIPDFLPYRPKSYSKISTPDAIRATLTKKLNPSDLKSGFIYLYWFPGNFGYVKIGMTTRSIQIRLEEWIRQCGHDASSCGQEVDIWNQLEGMQHAAAVPHVKRVETLVHAELRDVRFKEVGCKGPKCGRTHKEWFKVDVEHAKKVVGKWSNWVGGKPYEEPKRGRKKWVLKDSVVEEEIEKLIEPLEREKVPEAEKRRMPRRNGRLRSGRSRWSRGNRRWSG